MSSPPRAWIENTKKMLGDELEPKQSVHLVDLSWTTLWLRSNQISEIKALTAFDHRIWALEDSNGPTNNWEIFSLSDCPKTQYKLKWETTLTNSYGRMNKLINRCCNFTICYHCQKKAFEITWCNSFSFKHLLFRIHGSRISFSLLPSPPSPLQCHFFII